MFSMQRPFAHQKLEILLDAMKTGEVTACFHSKRPLWLVGLLLPNRAWWLPLPARGRWPSAVDMTVSLTTCTFTWQSGKSCCAVMASPLLLQVTTAPTLVLLVWGSVWTTILLHPQKILLRLCLIQDGSTYILAQVKTEMGCQWSKWLQLPPCCLAFSLYH